ncbi:MAG: adenylate/guanylate cyclase domain-containing protein [Treponema sp.]|jgi:adenylate cyclase|nr:adenylate/guanylate cyclase domain-containing protein [Treponema sp.]
MSLLIEKNTDAPHVPQAKIRFPFGIKLVAIVTVIVVGASFAVTMLVAAMVSREFGRTAEDNNVTINNRAATVAEEKLYRVRSDALMLLDTVGAAADDRKRTETELRFFERTQDIAAVIIPGGEAHINRSFFKKREADSGLLFSWVDHEGAAIERAARGEPVLRNATAVLGIPLTVLFYPWQERGHEEAAVIFFSPDYLAEVFGEGANSTIMVNDTGDVLIHPDVNQMLSGANIADNPLFAVLRNSGNDSIRLLYTSEGIRVYGTGRRLSFAGASVLSSIEYTLVTGSIAATTRRNIFISLALMFLALLAVWFFSKTFTTPLKNLMGAAEKIEQGEFNLDLKIKSHDELGLLTERFIHMGLGLAEWELTKNLVGRFNNSVISGQARHGELVVTGERKKITVMYIDFFSFDALAGKLDPAETVTQMNRYFAKAADSVEKTGGVIDKITGSNITAVWGAPLSAGSAASDAMNAVRSALVLRAGLWELNSHKGEGISPLFRIGCGIHTAEAIAGRMGSPRLMEYSFIGNAADEAALAAGINRAAGSDILVTEAVWDLTCGQLVGEAVAADITGKSGTLFAVVNANMAKDRERPQWPYTLDEVRESLGISIAGSPDGKNGSSAKG